MESEINMIIKELFEGLRDYISYLYPGFIFFTIKGFLEGKKPAEDKIIVIKSICFSFILGEFYRSLGFFEGVGKPVYGAASHCVVIVCSISLAILSYHSLRTKTAKTVLEKLNIRTNINDNPIDIVMDYNSNSNAGLWMKIYLDDDNTFYEGALKNYSSEPEGSKYIIICRYSNGYIDNESKSEIIIHDYSEDENKYAILNKDRITRMECN